VLFSIFCTNRVGFGHWLHTDHAEPAQVVTWVDTACAGFGHPSSAIIARQMRAALGNELEKIYIRSLRAAGISERSILLKHALKNALIPVVTVIGFQVPVLLGGSFVVEQVFAIPGLGSLIVNAVLQQDLPLIQGLVLLTGLLIVLTNLLVDELCLAQPQSEGDMSEQQSFATTTTDDLPQTSSRFWLRLRRQHLALIALIYLALLVLVALLANWLAPYDPAEQNLRAALQLPSLPITGWEPTIWGATHLAA
jgi:peptide/nickel transport system permease protein